MTTKNKLEKDAQKVTEGDVPKLLDRWPKLMQLVEKSPTLRPFMDDLSTSYGLLKDYSAGHYRQVPWSTIAALVATLIYVLNPLDMLPDMIPLLGFIDDAGMLGLCWQLVRKDLNTYREFKAKQIGSDDP